MQGHLPEELRVDADIGGHLRRESELVVEVQADEPEERIQVRLVRRRRVPCPRERRWLQSGTDTDRAQCTVVIDSEDGDRELMVTKEGCANDLTCLLGCTVPMPRKALP